VYISSNPGLPLRSLLIPNGKAASFGSAFPGSRVFEYSRGREALADFVQATGMKPGDSVLLPAYICSAVLDPFERLGIKILFYPIDDGFAPDAMAVRHLLLQKPRAILIVHYFGFPPESRAIVQECRDRGLRIIEDCAHTLPLPNGSFNDPLADLTIYSLAKLLPVPDGALAVVNSPDLLWPNPPTKINKRLTRVNSIWQIANTAEVLAGVSLRTRLRDNRRTTRMLTDLREEPASTGSLPSYHRFQMSGIAHWINKNIDLSPVARRRKENYKWLLAATKSIKGVRAAFGDLNPPAAPLGFPVLVDDREAVRLKLISAGVDPRPIWSALPSQVPTDGFATARYIAAHNIVLPVHQDLTPKALAHIASALARAVAV
jgi:perosamine synthetase